MVLAPAQIERYQRHIMLREIGGGGQQALRDARILIIGMGGLGNPLAQYLAAAGIGTLGMVDDDVVSLSNLQRQILFGTQDVGRKKIIVAGEQLARLNHEVNCELHDMRLTQDNAAALIRAYDIIADCSDNFTTRFLVNDTCFYQEKPLVSAAIGRFEGQLATFKPYICDADNIPFPCYRSLVSAPPVEDGEEENCAHIGVVGALAGVMGSLQALEIIKEVTGAGESLAGKLLIYDGLTAHARIVRLPWDPANPLNGTA